MILNPKYQKWILLHAACIAAFNGYISYTVIVNEPASLYTRHFLVKSSSWEHGMYSQEKVWFPSNITVRCPFLKTAESHRIQPSSAIPLTTTPWHGDGDIYPHTPLSSSSGLGVFIFCLLRRLTPKPPCFPLKTFLFALYISALSAFALCFSICLLFSPFLFHFLPPSLSLHLPLYPSPIRSLSLF